MQVQSSTKSTLQSLTRTVDLIRLALALSFLAAIMIVVETYINTGVSSQILVIAAIVGGYMAMNIGANDVANNVGPAVGSKAISLGGAIVIAAIFETSGALIAGGDVVGTIKEGIIDPAGLANADTFVWAMLAALLAAAVWLNVATAMGAPVSTTHSIVGGVLGAGIAAGGWGIANWSQTGAIAASWVISPMIGGAIAAGFLYLIKRTITYQPDLVAAARRMVPILVGVMAWAFVTYLLLKGFSKIWKVPISTASLIGLGAGLLTHGLVRIRIVQVAAVLANNKDSINRLFIIPLIFAAALLSFAHGANDVANAVGPLAGINDAILHHGIVEKAAIPLWIMVVGALGLAMGLALYGPRLIRTVGSEITELDQTRAFCIALSAAITVIVASQLGLPVSSTHIAVGGVFGVGFLREYLKANYDRMIEEIRLHHHHDEPEAVETFLAEFESASIERKGHMLKQLKKRANKRILDKKERKKLRKIYRKNLVKRSILFRVVLAWVVTVPVSAAGAAMLFFMIRGFMLP